jgi:hypothetical protein
MGTEIVIACSVIGTPSIVAPETAFRSTELAFGYQLLLTPSNGVIGNTFGGCLPATSRDPLNGTGNLPRADLSITIDDNVLDLQGGDRRRGETGNWLELGNQFPAKRKPSSPGNPSRSLQEPRRRPPEST